MDHKRLRYFDEIADAFDELMSDYLKIADVTVTTAVPLTDSQRERLTQKLTQKFGRTIRLMERIDSRILGGMVVQYGDLRLDNSLKTRLHDIKQIFGYGRVRENMNLRPDEITGIIKEQLKKYEPQLDLADVGTVITVGDGIARVHGLEKCMDRRTLGI